ncbi:MULTISPECIES: hypothetical protein [Stenotrophomonas]|uniref:hypothetical protein n=1 Tax=Stenotrophomonas TaxID=40323 RepID=UPI00187632CE|nr:MULTISPECIES: hypothetical protein [Stenotrophomonas]MBE5271939.1 hypothetical protein [Stenotrophomonas sp. B2]
MKIAYVATAAALYIAILSIIVFKAALDQGNVVNMIFSASSFTILLSLIKVIVDDVRLHRSSGYPGQR